MTVSEARIILNIQHLHMNNARRTFQCFEIDKSKVEEQAADITSRSEQLAEKVSEILSITAKIKNVLRQPSERLDIFTC